MGKSCTVKVDKRIEMRGLYLHCSHRYSKLHGCSIYGTIQKRYSKNPFLKGRGEIYQKDNPTHLHFVIQSSVFMFCITSQLKSGSEAFYLHPFEN